MNDFPEVSVIMPAYQASDTIISSIKSVQCQTLKNWELIIVDDGSTDGTAKIAEVSASCDPRIRLVRQANKGPSAARNMGVKIARANTLAFLDADDQWAKKRLEGTLETFASMPDVGVLFSRTRFVDSKTGKQGTLTPFIRSLAPSDLLAENAVCSTSNIVCRREVFEQTGGFAEGLDFAEDQDWLLRVAVIGKWQIRGINAEWFFYRSDDTSQSSDLESMRRSWHRMVASTHEQFPQLAPRLAKRAYGPLHRQLARRALRMGRCLTAAKYLLMALGKDPFLVLRQPRRTMLTLCGIAIAFLPHAAIKELVAK